MSVASQQSLRKVSTDSHESKKTQDSKVPKEGFKELLKAMPVDENLRGKDFFALVAEEEEKEEKSEPTEGPVFEVRSVAHLSMAEAEALNNSVTRLAGLSPAIEAAFEKMASCMIVMTSTHETETTIFLDNANSSLHGTTITIREFSTAPKIFNVEIVSHAQAVALIDSSKNDLLSAFQKGNFNFSIHRFDTHLQKKEDRPVLHRKEQGGGHEHD